MREVECVGGPLDGQKKKLHEGYRLVHVPINSGVEYVYEQVLLWRVSIGPVRELRFVEERATR